MKRLNGPYLKFCMLFITLFCSLDLFANSSKLRAWGNNTVQQGQSIGLSWITGALVVCGFLSLIGIQFAQGMLARILMGAALIFGASGIGSFLKAIVG
jgi:hypothetical protein